MNSWNGFGLVALSDVSEWFPFEETCPSVEVVLLKLYALAIPSKSICPMLRQLGVRQTRAMLRDRSPLLMKFNVHDPPRRGTSTTSTHRTDSLLSYFPCRLVYITSCRCWKLQKYVDFDPEYLWYAKLPSTPGVDAGQAGLCTDLGEVNVTPDGLLHPETACKYLIMSERCVHR